MTDIDTERTNRVEPADAAEPEAPDWDEARSQGGDGDAARSQGDDAVRVVELTAEMERLRAELARCHQSRRASSPEPARCAASDLHVAHHGFDGAAARMAVRGGQ
jgi:hypothetical protein